MIEILLPVYNGEKYLAEQIDSILAQTNHDWVLKIRNDGSIDNSQNIINEYCRRYPTKIVEIKSPQENVGLINSLNILLETATDADYIMFSDQDDVWLPNKIQLSIDEIKKLEEKYINKPVMVCTDAICTDSNLIIISPSFFKSQKFIPNIVGDKYKMLALNQVQGCTIMINRSTYIKIYPLPSFMKIHDMWVGVICAHYGVAKYLPVQTLFYRQHASNTLGGQSINLKYYFSRIGSLWYLLQSRYKLFKILPFKINYFRWGLLKLYYCLKRLK